MKFSFSEYIDLIKTIGETHLSLKGFLFGSFEDFLAITRSEIEYPFLFLVLPTASLSGQTPDSLWQSIDSKLLIVQNFESGNLGQKITALKEIYLIYEDILSYFRRVSYPNPQFKLDGVTVRNITGWTADNLAGIEMRFELNYSPVLTYNPDRWLPEN